LSLRLNRRGGGSDRW